MAVTPTNKIITPAVSMTSVPLSAVRPGAQTDSKGLLVPNTTTTPFNPNQDLERTRLAYEASLAKPVVPSAPSPVDKAKTDFVTNTSSSAGITGGSDNIRNQMAQTSSQASNLYSDLIKSQDTAVSNSDKRLAELDKTLADINKFNDQDLNAVLAAGQEAGAKFVPQIAEAQQSLKQGLAKANVGAGERGGFMNTQFAGQAALTPTEGGNFVGAGGELSRIKGTLENNIQQLEIAKSTAENAAMEAARKAIRTGKREDMQLAQSIYDRAVEADRLRADAVTKRIDVISKLDAMNRENITFGQEQQDRALKQLDTISKVGADITPEMEQQIDSVYGPGFTLDYANTVKKAADAKTEAEKADAAATVIGIMSKLPAGTKRTINGVEYEGIATQDPNTQIFAEQKGSDVTYVTIDKTTGIPINQVTVKGIAKSNYPSGPTSSDLGVSPEDIKALLASRGADGKVNTILYSQVYDKAVIAGPKALSKFIEQLPPKVFVNPATGAQFLQSNSQALGGNTNPLDKIINDTIEQSFGITK